MGYAGDCWQRRLVDGRSGFGGGRTHNAPLRDGGHGNRFNDVPLLLLMLLSLLRLQLFDGQWRPNGPLLSNHRFVGCAHEGFAQWK